MSSPSVILVDDEEHIRLAAEQAFDLADLEAESFSSATAALDRLDRDFAGVIVTDIRMPGMDGMTFMAKALEVDPELPVVLVTGHGDVQLAVEAMRRGAYDFIEKPFATGHLVEVVRRAIDKRRLTLENRELRSAVGRRDDLEERLIGRTEVMVALRRRIRAIAETDADVLIVGDTGSGKEIAARALHATSARAGRPFVAINCGALPANLIENELFGHEAGAFPGAVRERYGKFEHARGGTVFLDEIESMPLELQVKLLRVIQERSVTRLGSNEAIDLDVRFVAASKADLESEAAQGRFRADLLYCLNVVTLLVPSLAERAADIPRLFTQLVNEAAARYHKSAPTIPAEIYTALTQREWPGNVRELRNAADRFALGLGLETKPAAENPGSVNGVATTLSEQMDSHERKVVASALAAHGGRLNDTYAALGLSRKALYEKMRKHDLNRDDFRDDAIAGDSDD